MHQPVGKPRTKYLFGPGLKSLIRLSTYFAAHSATLFAVSNMISLILKTQIRSSSIKHYS